MTVYSKEQRRENSGRFKVAFTCVILLGLTWVLGLFAVGEATYTFQLLFCIFNAFQGLYDYDSMYEALMIDHLT